MTAVNRIVVIGASSGGIEALKTIAAALPRDFPAPICAVVHTSPASPGVLGSILSRAGALPAVMATSGARLEPGRIYVAPADHHLIVEPGVLQVTKGPKENRFRPAVDPLFRSAAQVYGPAAIGVVLTGDLDDGTAGLWSLKQLGGVAIVQDPDDALFPSMPLSALRHVKADYTVPLSKIAPSLVRIVGAPVEARERSAVSAELELEVTIAKEGDPVAAGIERLTQPSRFACPECHGVLLLLKDTALLRYRCHTGHAYSAQSLVAAINEGIEAALWSAVRALEEGALLVDQLAAHVEAHDDAHGAHGATHLAAQGRAARERANAIRELVTGRPELTTANI